MSNEVVIREEINSVEELSTDTTKYYHYTVDMLVQRKSVYFRVDGNMSESHKRKILNDFDSRLKMSKIIENECGVDEWENPDMMRSHFIEMDPDNYSTLDPDILNLWGDDKSHKKGWFFDLSIGDDGNLLVEEETEDNIWINQNWN